MSGDVAELGLKVESASLKEGTVSLKDFSAASKTAATGADSFNASAAETETRARAIAAAAERMHITIKEAEARFRATNSQVNAGTEGLGQYAKQAQQVAQANAQAMKAANDNAAGTTGMTASLLRGVAVLSVYGAALHSAFTIAVGLLDMLKDKAPTIEQTLAEHARLLGLVKEGYDKASQSAKKWTEQSKDVTQLQLLQQELDIRQKLSDATAKFLKNDALQLTANGGFKYVVPDQLKPFEGAITRLKQSWEDATPNVREFKDEVAKIALQNPDIQKLANHLIDAAGDASKLRKILDQNKEMQSVNAGNKPNAAGRALVGLSDPPKQDDPFARNIISVEKHIAAMNADAAAVDATAGEHARLRVEAQLLAVATLDGAEASDKQKKKIEELGQAASDAAMKLALAQIQSQIKFGKATALLSQEDVQIAAALKTIYPDVATALGSVEAQAMRSNNQLKQMNDIGRAAATQFSDDLVKGLGQGLTAVDALHNAFKNLASSLTSGALKNLFEGDFLSAGIKGIAAIGAAIFSANTSSSGDKWLKEQTANMNQRLADYSARVAMIGVDTNTRAGAVLAQDAEFTRQRIDENQKGGQAMNVLLQLQVQERNQLLKDWDQKDTDIVKANADAKLAIERAANDRALGFQNRLFAATNDFSTLEGQLAAFDRAASQERLTEAANDNNRLADLDATLAAERLNVIQANNDKIVEADKAAAQSRIDAINGTAKNILEFVNSLYAGPSSTDSPTMRRAAAGTIYNTELALAQSGDAGAQSRITTDAQNLLDAERAISASSEAFQQLKNNVAAQLLSLPAVQETTDPALQVMRDVLTAINLSNVRLLAANDNTTNLIVPAVNAGNAVAVAANLASYLNNIKDASLGTKGVLTDNVVPAVNAGSASATAAALTPLLNQIDPSGKLASVVTNTLNAANATGNISGYTQAYLPAVYNTNADAANNTANTKGAIDTNNNLTGNSNTILSAIQGLQTTSSANLALMQIALAPSTLQFSDTAGNPHTISSQMVAALEKIEVNTYATALNTYLSTTTQPGGTKGVLASGGWITGGIPGRDSVPLASGNAIGMPGEFVVRHDIAQMNRSWLPDFNATGRLPFNDNLPTVAPPVFRGGGSSNADLIAAIARLEARLDRIEGNTSNTIKAVIGTGNNVARNVAVQTEELGQKFEKAGERVSFEIRQRARSQR